jgi:hypothetical protein
MKKSYSSAKGAVDLYIYFFERGLELLRYGGRLAFISPNRYLSASYGKALRNFLIEQHKIDLLVDYSDTRVFPDAATYPVITFLSKEHPSEYVLQAGRFVDGELSLQPFPSSELTALDDNILGFLLNDKLPITRKVIEQAVSLTKVGEIQATSTASEAEALAAFISEDGSGWKVINTGTIDPFESLWGRTRFTKMGKAFRRPILTQNLERRFANRAKLYSSPKIVIAKIGLRCEALLDRDGEYASIDTNCIHSLNENFLPEYVLCWLNSRLYNYLYECLFDGLRMQGGYLSYAAPNLRSTYIKRIPLTEQQPFIVFANTIMDLKNVIARHDEQFRTLVMAEAGITSWPSKLHRWWEMDFAAFSPQLPTNLSIFKKRQILQLLGSEQPNLRHLSEKLATTLESMNHEFNQLFGLTPEELAMVSG